MSSLTTDVHWAGKDHSWRQFKIEHKHKSWFRNNFFLFFFHKFLKVAGQGGGNFYDGREMTQLERRERIRKEARHMNHHVVVCYECPYKYLLKNPTKTNKVVLRKKWKRKHSINSYKIKISVTPHTYSISSQTIFRILPANKQKKKKNPEQNAQTHCMHHFFFDSIPLISGE